MDRRFLTPWPLVERAEPEAFSVTGKIGTPAGWLDLNDGEGYQLEGSAFGDRSISWRKQEVNSPFVEGTFVVSAVRENVTETVSVWVRGNTFSELDERVGVLLDAFGQLSYRFMLRYEDSARYWTCSPAEVQITSQREYLHSRLVLVRASVPRLPKEEIVLASGDEL